MSLRDLAEAELFLVYHCLDSRAIGFTCQASEQLIGLLQNSIVIQFW